MKMKKKKTATDVTQKNLFSEAFPLLGVLGSTLLSFIITVICSTSDYFSTKMLFDSVQNQDERVIKLTTFIFVIFLNFSMYIFGVLIKRYQVGMYLRGGKAITIITALLSFGVFAGAFYLSFIFKMQLKDILFGLDNSAVDGLVNSATQNVAEVVNTIAPDTISQDGIIYTAALISTLIPAFTSILSTMSVFMFYDPIQSHRASVRLQYLMKKYRLRETEAKLSDIDFKIKELESLPETAKQIAADDFVQCQQHIATICAREKDAKIAQYTAGAMKHKNDQNLVTLLSEKAKSIKQRDYQPLMPTQDQTPDLIKEFSDDVKSLMPLAQEYTAPCLADTAPNPPATSETDSSPCDFERVVPYEEISSHADEFDCEDEEDFRYEPTIPYTVDSPSYITAEDTFFSKDFYNTSTQSGSTVSTFGASDPNVA